MKIREHFKTINERSAAIFLILLLSGDLVYILLHCINSLSPWLNNFLLDITVDYSYAETYQYMKFFFATLLIIKYSLRNETFRNLAWAAVFAYMLLDDSLEIHGKVGGYIAINFLNDFVPPFGLRLEDVGSLIASSIVGIAILIVLSWAYWKGSKHFRKVSHDFILLILIMVFFGVFFDMVHIAISGGIAINLILEIIEDGGEMLAASLILWYSFLINLCKDDEEFYLLGFLPRARKRST